MVARYLKLKRKNCSMRRNKKNSSNIQFIPHISYDFKDICVRYKQFQEKKNRLKVLNQENW